MSDAWDGRPENPERDGWHWLLFRDGLTVAAEWSSIVSDPAPWAIEADWWTRELVRINCTYLGPCLTPAEVEARVVAARRQALEEAAKVCDGRSLAWAERNQPRDAAAHRENEACACGEAIRALREDGR